VTAVLLALLGAAAYGVSDFIGGMFGKRASAWAVAATGGVGGASASAVFALVNPGDPSGADLAWGAAAGVGMGVGTAFLYRGLAGGRMGVVAPISGVLAVALPVLVGVLTGERPGLLVWVGIVAAVPAIWLVARAPSTAAPGSSGSGAQDGVLAGVGFGGLFACLGQVPDSAGFWPLVLNQVVAVVVVAIAATVLGATWLPRERAAWGGALAGLLGGVATCAFLLATHHGLLSVSAVLTSLYPAYTVLLAAVVLREHVHRLQAWGLALCGVAVVLVAVG
jgi:drug/metabolite transporter (DMT)-like permease